MSFRIFKYKAIKRIYMITKKVLIASIIALNMPSIYAVKDEPSKPKETKAEIAPLNTREKVLTGSLAASVLVIGALLMKRRSPIRILPSSVPSAPQAPSALPTRVVRVPSNSNPFPYTDSRMK